MNNGNGELIQGKGTGKEKQNAENRIGDGATEVRQLLVNVGAVVDKEWMNAHEAARYFGITYGALRNMTYRREIPFFKFGKRLRFRIEDVRNHILKNQVGINEWKPCL